MLKRLYVHNYKCLVNFEINFDKDISLFLGANGSGKSTVFEVLAKLRRIIVDEEKLSNVFENSDKPRWIKHEQPDIRFELDIEIEKYIYKYILILHFNINEWTVFKEFLYLNEKAISEIDFINDISSKPGLSSVQPYFLRSNIARNNQLESQLFLEYLRTLYLVRIIPYGMLSTINKPDPEIRTDFSNYGDWFAHLNEKNRRGVSAFEKAMREVLPGFDYFKIEQAGQAKVLQIDFENTSNKKEVLSYYFNELSEGQKVLIALYTLVYCVPENSIICIDEPENFLALPEIQPWFDALYDQCTERGLQTILISHHPKIINFLANDAGYWFSRENNLTRLQKISAENESGLSIAELIERGWIDEP